MSIISQPFFIVLGILYRWTLQWDFLWYINHDSNGDFMQHILASINDWFDLSVNLSSMD